MIPHYPPGRFLLAAEQSWLLGPGSELCEDDSQLLSMA
jgi:hypothetical protein